MRSLPSRQRHGQDSNTALAAMNLAADFLYSRRRINRVRRFRAILDTAVYDVAFGWVVIADRKVELFHLAVGEADFVGDEPAGIRPDLEGLTKLDNGDAAEEFLGVLGKG